MKKYLIGAGLVTFVLLLFSGLFWVYEAKYLIGRASVTVQSFSVDNSYMFVSPLQAKADNTQKIRVTVFILSDQGLGVAGRRVTLLLDPFLTSETSQGITDSFGKAVFDVSSSKVGEYYEQVNVDGKILPQKAHLSFN